MIEHNISIERGGILLRADPRDIREAGGILNPAVAGNYLLYRAVAPHNYSRIMVAEMHSQLVHGYTQVVAQKTGRVALEPQEEYELVREGQGGIEDPRVTQMPDGRYVMFYTGYGRSVGFRRQTPVVAAAVSYDGLNWERQGRITFAPYIHQGKEVDFNQIPNKDTTLFSERINGRFALLHRPMFSQEKAASLGLPWRGIWYAEADNFTGPWNNHHLLLKPRYPWENGGVGAGIPPIHLRRAWLHVYHGFTKRKSDRQYSAGVFLTSHNNPKHVLYRSPQAILEPRVLVEQQGVVSRVVFPTAAWENDDIHSTLTVFWGAADSTIMWGVLSLPTQVTASVVDGQHTVE